MNTQPHEPSGRRRLGTKIIVGVLPIVAIGWILSISGCTYSPYCRDILAPYDDMSCQCFVGMKARCMARSLWRSKYAHCYGQRGNSRDIRQGFIDGFVDTATGRTVECMPIVPPERYCGLRRKVAAQCWFEGYPLGMAAAESAGACEWCTMTISPELTASMSQPSCNPGCSPCQAMCGCGNPQCNGSCGIPAAAPMVEMPVGFDPNMSSNDVIVQQPIVTSEENQPFDDQRNAEGKDEDNVENLPLPTPDSNVDAPMIETNVDRDPVDSPVESPASPSDAIDLPSPAEAIERAIDDNLSENVVPQPQLPPAASVSVPVVAEPVEPTIPSSPPASAAPVVREPVVTEPVEPTIQGSAPVVGEPVEMPNMQVSFDLYDEGWLFGDVDIARALLEQDVTSEQIAE